MRTLSLVLLLAAAPATVAAEHTVIVTGGWSETVNGLRGRLILAQGRTLGDTNVRESLVYVELENTLRVHAPDIGLLFDADALKCELTNADGKAVPQATGGGSGGRPGKKWVTIPFDGSVRLRANPFGFGRADGMFLQLNASSWHIKDDDDFFISGSLTGSAVEGKPDAWKGELRFPRTKISLKAGTDWSENKDGLTARLRLVKDDELHRVRVLLEVNNPGVFGSGILFPGEPQVELSVFEDSKPLKSTFAAVSIARAVDPKDSVISGGSFATFRLDWISAKTGRAGYLLLANVAWELEPGKMYTVKSKLISRAKDPKGWNGPLELPPVRFTPVRNPSRRSETHCREYLR